MPLQENQQNGGGLGAGGQGAGQGKGEKGTGAMKGAGSERAIAAHRCARVKKALVGSSAAARRVDTLMSASMFVEVGATEAEWTGVPGLALMPVTAGKVAADATWMSMSAATAIALVA